MTISVTINNSTLNYTGGTSSYYVTGNFDTINLSGYGSLLSVTGSGDKINVTSSTDNVTVGGNGQGASNANDEIVNFTQGGTVTELVNSRADIWGSAVTVAMGGSDALGLYGAGDTVNTGKTLQDAIWIGGNGATGLVDTVNFGLAGAGAVYVQPSSNVAINGNAIGVTVVSGSAVQATGMSLNISVTGANDLLSVGGNGTGSDIDTVNVAAGATINEQYGSRVDVIGDNVTETVGGADIVGLFGAGEKLTVANTGVSVWIGGNGANGAVDQANFQTAGALNVVASSNVALTGSSMSATLAGSDTLTASGVALNIVANGANDVVNVGGTGLIYSTYADTVTFAGTGGVLNVADSGWINCASDYITATLSTNDDLALWGKGEKVTGSSASDTLWIGGDGQYASNADDNLVTMQNGGVVYEVTNSRADITGNSVTITAQGSDNLGVYGSGDTVYATGAGVAVWIGNNGQNAAAAAYDTVAYASGGALTELTNSTVTASGNGVTATIAASDTLNINGNGDIVTATGGNDVVNVTGRGIAAANTDYITMNAGGTVGVYAGLTPVLRGVITTPGSVDVTGDGVNVILTTGDVLSLHGTGDTISINSGVSQQISGFASGDALSLNQHFTDIAALIAATTFSGGNAMISQDTSGDVLTLAGVSQSQFTALANSGAIKFL